MNEETTATIEQKEPLPLESVIPVQAKATAQEPEKGQYWNRLLTGDLDTVPYEVRRKVGEEGQSAAERDYRLAADINRSWVVDHRNLTRGQVKANWPELRKKLADELGVQNSEEEVYAGLSLQNQERPIREEVRRLFQKDYTAALNGQELETPDSERDRRIAEVASMQAMADRERYLPLAEDISQAWSSLKALETRAFPFPEGATGMPALLSAVNTLAGMEPEERAKVYAITRSLGQTQPLESIPEGMWEAMLHSVRRGVADMRHYLLQGAGHLSTSTVYSLADSMGSRQLYNTAASMDKHLQVLNELRQVGQQEVYPIKLKGESGLAEELALDMAYSTPGVALTFMGGAGFGSLLLAGTGATMAESRARSSGVNHELQTAAGLIGAGLQAGIYMALNRIGGKMLERSINSFLKARGAGAKGYSLAALQAMKSLSAQAALLQLGGKAARVTELGMQELAARLDGVASNIDWENLGESAVDIETNLREAAMNFPYIMIGGGRAALHHFRAPASVLENRPLLEDWGVSEKARQRILELPSIHEQTIALRDALRASKRWGGPGMIEDCIRSLSLLNTDAFTGFKNEQVVRSFLNLPPSLSAVKQAEIKPRDLSTPESLAEVNKLMNGRKSRELNARRLAPYIQLWDEWFQKSNGEWIRIPQNFKERSRQYLEQERNPLQVLPREFRLDGYYTPYRAEVVRRVMTDQVKELVNLSFQYLMNTETLDSLYRGYHSIADARTKTEKSRCEVLSRLGAAMEAGIRSGDPETALNEFSAYLENRYATRRRSATNAPSWMRVAKPVDFKDGYQKSHTMVLKGKKSNPPELMETYRLMMGFRSCAKTLMDIIPHSEDFQELLNMGYAPQDAFTHLLARELKGHVNPESWNPVPLNSSQRNDVDNVRRLAVNMKLYERYARLSGNKLESSVDDKGKTLWHIKRPDGKYTPWFPSQAMAVNSLAGNVKTLFLPMGRGALSEDIQKAYRYTPQGKGTFYMSFMYKHPQLQFSGFDHLGRTASRDLCAQWLGDSTHYTMGLEFASNYKKWKNLRGPRLQTDVKIIKDGNDGYLVKQHRVETPLSLARLRFLVYWHRQLTSGWVTPEQVGRSLVEAGAMSADSLEDIMASGRERKIHVNHLPLEVRRKVLRKYPGGVVPADMAMVKSELARRMADLNVVYMMSNLQESKLPDSVREWFYTCAFSDHVEVDDGLMKRGLVRLQNRRTAEDIKRLTPQIQRLMKLKQEGKPILMEEMLRDAYEPNEARRYEQGWCFSIGGISAFRSSGQTYWNLLADPARGWKLLTPEEQAAIRNEIEPFCQGREPEQALQELSGILKEIPQLRAYSSDPRRGGQVKRLVLDPIRPANIADPIYSISGNSLMMRPISVKNGFEVEEQAELPAEWKSDSRVLPALQLLTELRRNVTAAPYADAQGIWWQQERYGGLDGKRPNGVDSRWEPEAGLKSFMDFYEKVAVQGDAYGSLGKLNVCGVPLGGIKPGDIDSSMLNLVTIYRNSKMPEHQVRLMPGEPNASNPYQRKPYVVHTADGVPLFPKSMARYVPEIVQTFTPLNSFNSDLERSYDFDSNHRWRRAHMEHYLNELINRRTRTIDAWDRADEGQLNNMELFMQMFQDSRLSYYLETRDPSSLTRGEALAAELGRLMLLAEFGTAREANVEQLVAFCSKLRDNWEDRELLKNTLHRVVSPDPNRLKSEELPRPAEDRELDLSPEDAEYY